MFQHWGAQSLRPVSAEVSLSLRSSHSLVRTLTCPDEHLHDHPRYGGLHLVTPVEDRVLLRAPTVAAGRVRRFLSALLEPRPRHLRRIVRRRTRPAA